MIKLKQRETIDRVCPDVHFGLNDEQVQIRMDKGYNNAVKSSIEKSVWKIIYDNVFTTFNIILFVIALVFFGFIMYLYSSGNKEVVDKYFGFSKFVFLIPAFINIMIGIIQEIRSRNKIRKLKIITESKSKVIRNGKLITLESSNIVIDDIVSLFPGEQTTADLVVLSGEISVDESHLTGESDFIKKKVGDTILSGSSIMIGEGKCRVIEVGDNTYAAQLSKRAKKEKVGRKSELIKAIFGIIKMLSVALLVVTLTIVISLAIKISMFGNDPTIWDGMGLSINDPVTWARIMIATGSFGIGMIPTGLVLTTSITLMLSIVSLSGKKTLIQELYSLENLSRVDVICLDKTGTLTDGSMDVYDVKAYCSYNDVVDNVRDLIGLFENRNQTLQALYNKFGCNENVECKEVIPFSSETKSSGFVKMNGDKIILGAPEYIVSKDDERFSYVIEEAKKGNRVLAFKKNDELLCFFVLVDHIRETAKDILEYFDENNVCVKIISGDSPFTVEKIARECGVKNSDKVISLENVSLEEIPNICEEYTIFARVSPEQKEALVEALQEHKHKVAMTGDGVNDILALRKSDSSITFSNATEAAKACSDVILLDNDFSHMKDVVGEGRRVINNIQRVAVIFLTKSISIILLALLLIPFAKGQMWYTVENAYMLEIAVIGVGGVLLSFETKKEPIRGAFVKNIYLKALAGGVLGSFALIIPIIMNRIPKYYGYTSMISDENVKTMMTILFVLAGLVVTISMCMPFNKYRAFCLFAILVVAILLGLVLPNTYLGGLTTGSNMLYYDPSIGQTIRDSQLLKEMFKPWNSQVIQNFVSSEGNYYLMRIFMFVSIPLFLIVSSIINYNLEKDFVNKQEVKNRISVGKILLLISSVVLFIEALVSLLDISALLYEIKDELKDTSILVLACIVIGIVIINSVLYFIAGSFGYKTWKTGKENYKKKTFILGLILIISLLIQIILFTVGEFLNQAPLASIDSLTGMGAVVIYIVGAIITKFSKQKQIS